MPCRAEGLSVTQGFVVLTSMPYHDCEDRTRHRCELGIAVKAYRRSLILTFDRADK